MRSLLTLTLATFVVGSLAFQPYDPPQLLISAPENETISEFLIADLNYDGILDVVFAALIDEPTSAHLTNLYVALGQNTTSFLPTSNDSPMPMPPAFGVPMLIDSSHAASVRFAVVDWDAKGDLDVCVAEGEFGFRCFFFFFDDLHELRHHTAERSYNAAHIATFDTNADGREDIVVLDNVEGVVHIYYNIGDGSFDYTTAKYENTGVLFHSMHKFDFNSDGNVDLLLTLGEGHQDEDDPFPALPEGRPLLVENNDGKLGFWLWAEPRQGEAPSRLIRGDPATGDVSGDAINDFVALAHDAPRDVYAFIGNGQGRFGTTSSTLTPPCSDEQELTYVALFDFDEFTPQDAPTETPIGGAFADLIVGWTSTSTCPSTVTVHANTADGAFSSEGTDVVLLREGTDTAYGGEWMAHADLVDVDFDGRIDLVATAIGGRHIVYFRNNERESSS